MALPSQKGMTCEFYNEGLKEYEIDTGLYYQLVLFVGNEKVSIHTAEVLA
jgi:hypothetical protein